MDYVHNFSNLYSPNWVDVAPYEPERRERQGNLVSRVQTALPGAPDFFGATQGPSAPTSNLSRQPGLSLTQPATTLISESKARSAQPTGSASKDAEGIARNRVRLMAANYVGGNETTEIVARLEILNRRLLDQSPRIRVEQVQSLEAAAALVANVRQSREEIMKRLGIKA